MRNKTRNLQEYRKKYYHDNKVHLNAYQKWYASYKKFLRNEITEDEVPEKPNKKRKKNFLNPKIQKMYFTKGDYLIDFE